MESHQVVVVEAPTGSGKSTFLPWRLLAPPAPYASDHVTRHGTIVVTQPRIEATQGIPGYIAENLHGARVGAGLDIGSVTPLLATRPILATGLSSPQTGRY